jgi:uncharacterized BrkB/YihY/UPF0761 family membrane protein
MASRDLPYRDPSRPPWWRRTWSVIKTMMDLLFNDLSPVALGLEYGVASAVIGVAVWLIFGVVLIAFASGGLTFAALERRERYERSTRNARPRIGRGPR